MNFYQKKKKKTKVFFPCFYCPLFLFMFYWKMDYDAYFEGLGRLGQIFPLHFLIKPDSMKRVVIQEERI